MIQDMKKEPILQMGSDKMIPENMFMINPSPSDYLIEVNGNSGFNPTERGD
jgi:hypothetical protein